MGHPVVSSPDFGSGDRWSFANPVESSLSSGLSTRAAARARRSRVDKRVLAEASAGRSCLVSPRRLRQRPRRGSYVL